MPNPINHLFTCIVLLLAVGVLLPAKGRAQAAPEAMVSVSVRQPGTLSDVIGDARKYALTSLAVEGALNGTDLRYLREMAGSDYQQQPTEGRLRRLDLSKATFVPGGTPYIYKDTCYTVQGGSLTLPPFAFRHCRLEQVELPGQMDTLGVGAFEYSALRSVRLPENVVVMDWAFNHCDSLSQVEFPEMVAELGWNCFRDCGSLRTLHLHDIQFLSYHVLQHVTGLEEVIVDGTLWHADGWFCDDCPQLRRIELSGVVLTAGGPPIASDCPLLSEIIFSGFSFPIHYGAVENCPLVERCRVTGSVMGSGNEDFLPVVSDVSAVSPALLRRAFDAVSKFAAQPNRTAMRSVKKNNIVLKFLPLLVKRGWKDEALQLLRLLADSGFPYPSQITSDTVYASLKSDAAFVAVVEQMKENADFRKKLCQSPPYDTGSAFRQPDPPRLTYAAADDSLLQCIRAYFQADYIAGSGDELTRLKNVMFWVHDRVAHQGDFLPRTRHTAIDLVEGCRKAGREGMNARGQAIVLAELYQSLGWPARFITCQANYEEDTAAPVVTVVWSFTLGKWVMMDASMAAYVTDENGLLLHPGEIRQRMKDNRPLLLNEEANWNRKGKVTKEHYLDYYMAKNLYYLSTYAENRPGIDTEWNAAYYTLAPMGEEVNIGKTVYDDAWFWQKPF